MGRRCSSDLALLWLWYRLAAIALIGPLAWEPPCAMGAALKRQKKKEKKNMNTGCLLKTRQNTFDLLIMQTVGSRLAFLSLSSDPTWAEGPSEAKGRR